MNKEYGTTVICNLHFLSLGVSTPRVSSLKAGEMMFEGSPYEIDRLVQPHLRRRSGRSEIK